MMLFSNHSCNKSSFTFIYFLVTIHVMTGEIQGGGALTPFTIVLLCHFSADFYSDNSYDGRGNPR